MSENRTTTVSISDRDVFIVDCVRTPVGRGYSNGSLNSMKPIDLLATTLDQLMKRNTKVDRSLVEDVICGVVTPVREQGANIPRFAALKAKFPQCVPGVQLNRMCGSGEQAVHFGSQAIKSGDMDIVIACGVEMMGVVQMGSDWQLDETFKDGFDFKILHQGVSSEMIAEKYNISREEIDRFSGRSHELADKAQKNGYFKSQIIPVTLPDGKVIDKDEGIRTPVDYKKMATLKTPFKANGKISAANASQISDGSSAVLLVSGRKVKELGLVPRARIVATAVVGSDPELMLTGPIPATKKVLAKCGLSLSEIDIFEINEAFASVALAWQKELNIDISKVNPNGGAIALGHPLGATGCILMTKLVNELERSNKRYSLQTMCIGFGNATATILESCSFKPNPKL
ncbi:hypothetical protein DICPUDRAFT_149073 [Dictyostelium purpureum]|uniref:Acetyl-CoA acetyltransferase n=1 Tax=Dictyostelium purpureum TaxID=5786 RepID=F0ZCS2_DICPU|nr:uncharacterized protein DICPUDRAFT_149073 [Dictyostelium purpureum]EGC38270.1 hypothetical protein DICPUDRAFT_149073 [Dictyostelium purpureum]|eukprot:XP_003285227.1 hypothetical protein DICPUDRAFT_149073 [Dictyostelium purpureum]